MRRPLRALLFCLTTALFLAGCRTPPPVSASASASPTPTLALVVGQVAIVETEKRFVLIDLGPYLYVPAPGTPLRTRNDSGETGHLRASEEQKRPFIAADIVDGAPAVGDEVLQ